MPVRLVNFLVAQRESKRDTKRDTKRDSSNNKGAEGDDISLVSKRRKTPQSNRVSFVTTDRNTYGTREDPSYLDADSTTDTNPTEHQRQDHRYRYNITYQHTPIKQKYKKNEYNYDGVEENHNFQGCSSSECPSEERVCEGRVYLQENTRSYSLVRGSPVGPEHTSQSTRQDNAEAAKSDTLDISSITQQFHSVVDYSDDTRADDTDAGEFDNDDGDNDDNDDNDDEPCVDGYTTRTNDDGNCHIHCKNSYNNRESSYKRRKYGYTNHVKKDGIACGDEERCKVETEHDKAPSCGRPDCEQKAFSNLNESGDDTDIKEQDQCYDEEDAVDTHETNCQSLTETDGRSLTENVFGFFQRINDSWCIGSESQQRKTPTYIGDIGTSRKDLTMAPTNPMKRRESKDVPHKTLIKRYSEFAYRGFMELGASVSNRTEMTLESDTGGHKSRDNKYHIKERLCDYVLHDIVGSDHVFKGPWGANPVTYLDYVASGRPLQCIENYIRENVMPTYANTHTEVSFTAQQTTLFRDEARAIIKQSVNASEEDAVIFTGSGSTSAVNKLIHALKPKKPLVLVGPYEHHSNILPWTEIDGAHVVRIQTTKDGLIDLDHLAWELKKGCFHKREVIGSFSAASNVTGILTDVNAVCTLLHRHKGIALFDYACAAPYVDINMNSKGRKDQEGLAYKDAVFISTHKFIGGPGTPGLLIAKKHLFRNRVPHNVGGGTVQFVRRSHVSYRTDIEEREEGGTPAIIESIRAGLVFKLKDTFTASFIMLKEEEMLRKAKLVWATCPSLILLGNLNAARLPIFPMLFYNYETGLFLHHDFVAMVMNDVFGLQVRSGCACAGPYVMDLIGLSEEQAIAYEKLTVFVMGADGKRNSENVSSVFKPGFVRLNCPYFFTDETFNFVLKAVQMVATHGWKLLYLYDFDPTSGKWWSKYQHRTGQKKHLHDITFASGQIAVNTGQTENCAQKETDPSEGESELQKGYQGEDALSYVSILKRAQKILTPDIAILTAYAGTMKRKSEVVSTNSMRWFMLPEDTVDLLAGGAVRYVPPEELPFFPGALGVKLNLPRSSVVGHRARRTLDVNFPVEATGGAWMD